VADRRAISEPKPDTEEHREHPLLSEIPPPLYDEQTMGPHREAEMARAIAMAFVRAVSRRRRALSATHACGHVFEMAHGVPVLSPV
jgi:hypothetical protein